MEAEHTSTSTCRPYRLKCFMTGWLADMSPKYGERIDPVLTLTFSI